MKSRKNKLILNILTLCLCISAIAIGVYSAKNATLDISGSVAFSANYVKFKVESNVECASTTEADAIIKTFDTVTTECDSTNENGKAFSHDFGTLNFNDIIEGGNTVTVTLKITNQSEYRISVAMTAQPTFVDAENITAVIPTDMQTTVTNGGKEVSSGSNIKLDKNAFTTYTITLTLPQATLDNLTSLSGKLDLSFNISKYSVSKGLLFAKTDDGNGAKVTGIGTCTDKRIVIPDEVIVDNETLPVTQTGGFSFANTIKVAELFKIDKSQLPSLGLNIQTADFVEVIMPSTINKIEPGSFAFSKIKSVVVPEGVESLADGDSSAWHFYNCTELESVVLPESLTEIGLDSFTNCTSLKNINFPNNLSKICDAAFTNCTSLKSINIPKSLTNIVQNPFKGCTSLEKITVDANNPIYSSPNNCNAIIETNYNTMIIGCKNTTIYEGITSIYAYAFEDHTEIETINIPASVTNLSSSNPFRNTNCKFIVAQENKKYKVDTASNTILSFDGKTLLFANNISDISKIPSSVENIGQYAFSNCMTLVNLVIPEGIKNIYDSGFNLCKNLQTVILPTTLVRISSSFGNCPSLSSVTFKDTKNWKFDNSDIDVTDPITNAANLKSDGSWHSGSDLVKG